MDPLGQLYILCTFFGWGFIIACFAMGQIDHGGGGHGGGGHGSGGHGDGGHIGHDGAGGHMTGHGHGFGHGHGQGHGHGHEIARSVARGAHASHGLDAHGGHGMDSGHAGGSGGAHGTGQGHGGQGAGHGPGHGSGQGHGQGNNGQGHGHNGNADEAATSVNPVARARDNKLFFTLISLFSPMSLSLFGGFFGSVGFITLHYAPWMGYFSLIPAIGCSAVATEVLKRAMSTVVSKLHSSSLTRKEEAIGRIAKVNTPIQDGRLGEVSYVIGTTRFNASARAAHEGDVFERGCKVMIIDTEGPVVYVETAKDMDLELM